MTAQGTAHGYCRWSLIIPCGCHTYPFLNVQKILIDKVQIHWQIELDELFTDFTLTLWAFVLFYVNCYTQRQWLNYKHDCGPISCSYKCCLYTKWDDSIRKLLLCLGSWAMYLYIVLSVCYAQLTLSEMVWWEGGGCIIKLWYFL